jgi:hypothetical protein
MTPTPTGFEPHPRFDFFEPTDKTAMVCLDVPEMQRLVIAELDGLGYKVHTGLFLDDSVLKLRTHAYDVVILSEHFSGSTLENHPIIVESIAVPAAQRRRQTYILIGVSLQTNDELLAFLYNVDVVVSLKDVVNLKPVLRRAVNATAEFYAPLQEALASLAADERGYRPAGANIMA